MTDNDADLRAAIASLPALQGVTLAGEVGALVAAALAQPLASARAAAAAIPFDDEPASYLRARERAAGR